MALSPGYGLKLLVAPTWQPVAVADMEAHSRILATDVNAGTIQAFIDTAQDYIETATRRKIAQQQWLYTVDEFPGRQVDDYRPPTWRYGIFRLPFPPLISVDQVAYIDPTVSGAQPFPITVLDPSMWMYDANTEPGRLAPSPFNVWPSTNPLAFQAVQITFTCGYAALVNVPPGLVQAIKLLAAHLYEHREESTQDVLARIPLGLKALISANKAHEYC